MQPEGTATIDHTSISGNRVSVTDPNGPPVGFDPGICVCDSSAALTRTDSKVNGNHLVANVKTSVEGGSGGGLEADGNAVSIISGNQVTATSRDGSAIVRGAGLANTGPLLLSHVTISGNRATASAPHG